MMPSYTSPRLPSTPAAHLPVGHRAGTCVRLLRCKQAAARWPSTGRRSQEACCRPDGANAPGAALFDASCGFLTLPLRCMAQALQHQATTVILQAQSDDAYRCHKVSGTQSDQEAAVLKEEKLAPVPGGPFRPTLQVGDVYTFLAGSLRPRRRLLLCAQQGRAAQEGPGAWAPLHCVGAPCTSAPGCLLLVHAWLAPRRVEIGAYAQLHGTTMGADGMPMPGHGCIHHPELQSPHGLLSPLTGARLAPALYMLLCSGALDEGQQHAGR